MPAGETEPLTLTVVGAPTASLNKTWSPGMNTVGWLLPRLIQLAETPVSQVPVLPGLHCKFPGLRGTRQNGLDCMRCSATVREPLTMDVVPSQRFVPT